MSGLLTALQFGDSFFPSGASVFSFGLEGLHANGSLIDAGGVERFVAGQLEQRWACCERVALLHAHAAGADLARLSEVDELVDRSTLVQSWRVGGRRLGRALLGLHGRLGTAFAGAYLARVDAGEAPGQVSAVQGLVTFASGLSAEEAAAISGYGLAVGLVSVALRLGLLGHIEAQRVLIKQRARIAALIALPLPPLDELSAWVPEAEVASMRQEARHGRLFAS